MLLHRSFESTILILISFQAQLKLKSFLTPRPSATPAIHSTNPDSDNSRANVPSMFISLRIATEVASFANLHIRQDHQAASSVWLCCHIPSIQCTQELQSGPNQSSYHARRRRKHYSSVMRDCWRHYQPTRSVEVSSSRFWTKKQIYSWAHRNNSRHGGPTDRSYFARIWQNHARGIIHAE